MFGSLGLRLGSVILTIAHDHVRSHRRGRAQDGLVENGGRHEDNGIICSYAIPTRKDTSCSYIPSQIRE